MRRTTVLAAAAVAAAVWAEPSGDRPDARHAWAVHDVNRPDPVKITADEGKVPSDAIVLFDGTAESVAKNWVDAKGGPSKWTTKNGEFVCVPGSGPARTKEKFADCQLHVEWKAPLDDAGGYGNSGVLLHDGAYEIQILDSWKIEPSKSPWKPANYADGQAGAVYGQNPCLVNPARKPGEWQTFDIVFHPPTWEGEKLVDPGSFTVFFNGVLVQDHWELEGTTTWLARTKKWTKSPEGALLLQDHGNPVPFRNVWIRRIPSRRANTTNGGPGVRAGDVAKLRAELAAQSLAFADETDDPAEKFIRLWESFCYRPDAKVRARADIAGDALVKAFLAKDKRLDDHKLGAIRRFVAMLVREKFLAKDDELVKTFEGR
ncbi:MAG: DUF1080 domain-containing protein [Kiritimatiellae bacterium]|nr:DUF1080 domain-containing protein [Kiritimatiellia bacterium]